MGNRQRRLAAAAARRRQRLITIGVLVLVPVLVLAGVGVSFLASRPVTYEGSYEISAKIRPVPEGEDAPGPQANGWRIIFDSRWTGEKDRPNRTNQCRQEVLTADGISVNSKPFGLFTGELVQKGIYTPHLIKTSEAEQGLPVQARIECDPNRAGNYEITNVDVVKGWNVVFDARWDGGAAPPTSSCVVDYYDDKGQERELIETFTFEVDLGRERHEVVSDDMVLAADVPAPPEDVEVRCKPATG